MSKTVQANLYIDECVSSVAQARDYAKRAAEYREDIKGDIWGLILATPKDVVQSGEDPIRSLKERFNDMWEELWDGFIDDYKYTIIADDAEFVDDSLVRMAWEEEEREERKFKTEQIERDAFFEKHKDIMNKYNFDDITLYNRMREGKISITDSFTKEKRDKLIKEMKEVEKKEIEEALERMKKDEQ